jgi:GMP synthase (glutamine-hydrolysing)
MEKGILILDFGSQYTQLIARRIREMGVFTEIYPYDLPLAKIKELKPAGIVLSGGPSSVTAPDAPLVSKDIYELGLPVLGICYGLHLTTHLLGGKVEKAHQREYGKAKIDIKKKNSRLLKGVKNHSVVWMSHGDSATQLAPGFEITAKSNDGAIAAIENDARRVYAVQFHPEVAHSQEGPKILNRFVFDICKAQKNWSMQDFVAQQIEEIRAKCSGKKVVLGVSGGVDSTTLAVLMQKALGDNLTAIFVNNGLLRKDEAEEVLHNLRDRLKLKVTYIDATDQFLNALAGVDSPEQKRKIIGKVFIDVFYGGLKDFDYLVQGTLYPDVIESNPVKGPSQTIKTHHNRVPEVMELEKQGRIIEPFRFLFKDEVREVARILGMPADILNRHPFPGPGLAVRVLGDITKEKLRVLCECDAIFIDELRKSGWYDKTWQAFAVYLPVKSVGVMGDERAYGNVVVLRAVTSTDGMTANWARIPEEVLEAASNRIVRNVREITRVAYDITSKPPATIEWE